MRSAKDDHTTELPSRFELLVRMMPPQAIVDDVHCENTIEVIDRLMALKKLTKGQEIYLETLVQLVEAYEQSREAVDGFRGLELLKHLLAENGMTASALARLLGVHVSMGSKILKGERSLTVAHVKQLAARFKVRAELFLD